MGRQEDIKEQLDKDYELLKKLEDTLRTERDPLCKLKWTEDIRELKQRVHEHEENLKPHSTFSGSIHTQHPPYKPQQTSETSVFPKTKEIIRLNVVRLGKGLNVTFVVTGLLALSLTMCQQSGIQQPSPLPPSPPSSIDSEL